MDLSLTEDQELFRDASVAFVEDTCPLARVRELVEDAAGFDRSYLERAAELGWFAPFVPEEAGGGTVSGRSVLDAALLAEIMGRYVQPGPFVVTNVVAAALTEGGSETQRSEVLPDLATGRAVATWAVAGPEGAWDDGTAGAMVTSVPGGLCLNGQKGFVQDAHVADWFLVTASGEQGPVQLLVPRDAPGVEVIPLRSLDLARRFSRLIFSDVTVPGSALVGSTGDGSSGIGRQLDLAITLTVAETVGAMDRMFEMTLQYAKDRIAFGRPVGSFQAVKHLLADLGLALEMSKAAAEAAARAVQDNADHAPEVTSMAKSFVGDRSIEMSQGCLQVHGGIGYTWEHDLHLYMRRVSSNNALYGNPSLHRERICAAHGL